MKSDNTYIIHPETVEQETALRAFIKSLKMKFEISGKGNYNPDFVTKIEESRRQVKEGKTTRVEEENLNEFLGL